MSGQTARPYPLFVQGLTTGAAAALVIVASLATAVDLLDGSLENASTAVLILAAVTAACFAVGAYLPKMPQASRTDGRRSAVVSLRRGRGWSAQAGYGADVPARHLG